MLKSHAGGWASDAPTPAQLKELFAQIDSGRITRDGLQAFLRGKTNSRIVAQYLKNWADFYCKFFGIVPDFSGLKLPEGKLGFDRLIVVAKGLTLNQVYDVCVKDFPCWRYADDLDKAISHNDRSSSNSAYAIWIRNRVEADEELKNLSADQLKEQGIPGITLLEHLLYELKYWDETRKHLDVQNWTLCAGSRGSDGTVPRVDWRDSKLRVGWCDSDSRFDGLRARAAVPCQP